MSPATEPSAALPRARRNQVLAVTPGQLRTFAVVAELGSVRAAAGQLNVTESAVSASVASLQRQIGAPLLERAGRGVKLTAAGKCYGEHARRLLGELEEAAMAALGEASPDRGWLRIAAVTSVAEIQLPGLLAAFRARMPRVQLGLEVGPRDRVWQLLRAHSVDLAVAGRPPREPDVVTYALHPNELVVVAGPALTPRRGGSPTTWLLREQGSGTRATLEAMLDTHHDDAPRLTLGSNGAVIAGAVAGLGATLAHRDVVTAELADGRLVEVPYPGTPMTRPYHLVGRRKLPSMASQFVDHVLASGGWGAPSATASAHGRRTRSTTRTLLPAGAAGGERPLPR